MRRTGVALLLIGLVAAGAGVGWLAGQWQDSPPPSTPPVPPPSVAVEVGSIEETLTLPGRVGFPGDRTLRLATGSGVLTSAVPVGTTLEEGMAPFELDLRPLVILQGERPMFRAMSSETEGADVVQLQAALQRLGHYSGELDGEFGPGTRASWNGLQSELGIARTETVSPTEVVFTALLPARLDQVFYSVGQTASGDLGVITDPTAAVIADASRAEASQIEVGMAARVSVLGNNAAREGSVSDASLTEDPESQGSYSVMVSLGDPLADLEGLPLQVTVVLTTSPTTGLVIPVSALRTDAAGSTYVTRLDGVASTRVAVEVTFSTPTQAIIEAELSEGDRIVVGP